MRRLDRILIWLVGVLLLAIVVSSLRVLRHYPEARLEARKARLIHVDAATRARLKDLHDDVLVTYYVSSRRRLPSAMRQLEGEVLDVLDALKRAAAGKLQYQVIDPETEADFAHVAAHQRVAPFRVRTVTRDAYQEQTVWSTLHVVYGPRPAAVINGISPAHLPRLQSLLMAQLEQMEHPRQPVFALAAPPGYSELRDALAARGQVKTIALDAHAEIPADFDVLFWMDPGAVAATQMRQITLLLESGRSVVIAGSKHRLMLEKESAGRSFLFQPSSYGAEALLAGLGLRLRPELVLDSTCREIAVEDRTYPAPFLVRAIAPNQDFRTLTSLPNGALLFVAPTPFALDGAVLARRGLNAGVLVTTSDATTLREMSYGAVRLGSPGLEPGEPAPKLPLMVWLRPNEPWQGSLIALAAATPFQDGYFQAEGFAHKRLLQVLCDTLASDEHLVLNRTAVESPQPMREFSAAQRLLWRAVCVFLIPVLLGIVAWRRRVFQMSVAPAGHSKSMAVASSARALAGVAAVLVLAALLRNQGGCVDLSTDRVNELSTATQRLVKETCRNEPIAVCAFVSSPEHLPPDRRPFERRLHTMLRAFRRVGAKLSVTWVHPEELDGEARAQLEREGIKSEAVATPAEEVTTVRTVYSTVRLSAHGQTELVRLPDRAAYEDLEFRLAFALWRLQTGRHPHVAFLSDVPRLSPAEALEDFQKKNLLAPAGTDVYSQARAALEQTGFRVTHITPRNPRLPADTDLIVWMQPRRNIRPALDQVVQGLHRGVPVLLAAQHFNIQARQYQGADFQMVYWPQPQTPDIDQFYFPDLGIELVREVLFDELKAPLELQTQVNRSRSERDYVNEVSALPFNLRASSAHYAHDQTITSGLGDQVLPFANYLRLDQARLAQHGIRAQTLITTSERTWSYNWKGRWLPPKVLAGPPTRSPWLGRLPLAVLFDGRFPLPKKPFAEQTEDPGLEPPDAAEPPRPGRLLFLGCSHLFRDERLADPYFRSDHLLLNAVASLALPTELATVASHRPVSRGLAFVGADQRLRWRAFVLLAGPLTMLVGGAVWGGVRRQAGRARQVTPTGPGKGSCAA